MQCGRFSDKFKHLVIYQNDMSHLSVDMIHLSKQHESFINRCDLSIDLSKRYVSFKILKNEFGELFLVSNFNKNVHMMRILQDQAKQKDLSSTIVTVTPGCHAFSSVSCLIFCLSILSSFVRSQVTL